MKRQAKIVATVGPASWEESVLVRLLRAGVDVVRLNLSHGSRDEHRTALRRVRAVAAAEGRTVALLPDLMGPRYRLGRLPEERTLRRGEEVTLGAEARGVEVPLGDTGILRYLGVGERILVDNGMVELRVTGKGRGRVSAKVKTGGTLSSRKGINLPDSRLPFSVSDKDRDDIAFAVEEGADFVAASYVGRAADIEAVRRVAREAGGELPVVAKLERRLAVEHLEEIAAAADAVMVARGDLGVEVPLHQVPVLQKRMIDVGRRLGRPVIVATQMLESMMNHPRPTRAESSDVANAVFDGADAVMLSGETAAGRYPVEAVRTMERIVLEAEAHRREERAAAAGGERGPAFAPVGERGALEIPETVSSASVLAAHQVGARVIVALSQGGYTVRQLASRRPAIPVVALTRSEETARRLQLVWGVVPLLFTEEVTHHDEVVALVDRRLLEARLVKAGEIVVILMGDPIQARPPTNLMRIHRVRRS